MKFLPILPILTRYPFLKLAAEFFKSEFNSIEDALNSNVFQYALDIAKNIIYSCIDGKSFERSYETGDLMCISCDHKCIDDLEDYRSYLNIDCKIDYPRNTYEYLKLSAKISVLSYVISKIIISLSDNWIRMRFAVNEANYYVKLMSNEKDHIIRLIASDLGLKLKGWHVHISTYVKASSRIKSESWRLVNREFSDGYVYTSKSEVLRIIEEFLRERLAEKVEAEEFKQYFDSVLRDLKVKGKKKNLNALRIDKVDFEKFPPCIKEILAELQSGMNVPHIARFSLAAFLLNIGMKIDDVVNIFRSAPDFDEDKTRYQVEHIAGQRGRCVEYICPSCETMKSYHLCISDCNVKHPIEYYRKRFKTRRLRKKG